MRRINTVCKNKGKHCLFTYSGVKLTRTYIHTVGKTPHGIADTSDTIEHDSADDGEEEEGGGTDMSKLFKSLTKKGCKACVAAGYGWCPIKLMCGGFANRKCPEDAVDDDDDADMDDDLEGYASG